MVLIVGYPIFSVIVSSFSYSLDGQTSFGLANYASLLNDAFFIRAITITMQYTLFSVAANVLTGLVLALLFASGVRFQKFFFTLFLIPMLISGTSAAVMWRLLFNVGYMNCVLNFIGFPRMEWLGDPSVALYSLVLVNFWQGAPLMMLFLYAGAVSISTSLFEAAKIDGASRFQIFKYISFPLLKPVFLTTILLSTIISFKLFDYVYVMTGGGPGNATLTLSFYIYQVAFNWIMMEKASAGAVIMLVIVLMLSLAYVRILRK